MEWIDQSNSRFVTEISKTTLSLVLENNATFSFGLPSEMLSYSFDDDIFRSKYILILIQECCLTSNRTAHPPTETRHPPQPSRYPHIRTRLPSHNERQCRQPPYSVGIKNWKKRPSLATSSENILTARRVARRSYCGITLYILRSGGSERFGSRYCATECRLPKCQVIRRKCFLPVADERDVKDVIIIGRKGNGEDLVWTGNRNTTTINAASNSIPIQSHLFTIIAIVRCQRIQQHFG